MGVLLVSLWGSMREDVVVGVSGGGGFGREEWGWFFLDCGGLILRWVLWVFNFNILQDSVWLICCWVCVCASGFVDFGFQF